MAIGVGGGLDVASLVQQLVALDRAPATRWNSMRLTALSQQTAWSDIGAKLSGLRTAAEALDTRREVATSSATSSDDKTVSATAGNGALAGVTRLRVVALAVAGQLVTGGISGPSEQVGAGRAVVSSGTGVTGLGPATVSASLSAGRHTVTVHPQQPATAAGSSKPALDQPVGGSFTLAVDGGGATTYTLPTKTYASVEDLAAALKTSLGGVADVAVADGKLKVTGVTKGTGASLAFGAGSLETALGLASAGGSGVGVQASLDGGPRVSLAAGSTVTLATAAGKSSTVSFTPAGVPVPGTVALNVVDTVAGATLADLTAALNAGGSPLSASLVDTGDGTATSSRLALTASNPGHAGHYSIDTGGHAGFARLLALAGRTDTPPGDARLVVGGTVDSSGALTGGLTVTRSSNSVGDLLSDVTLNLQKTGDVTIGVTRDQAALATKAKTLVDGLNAVLSTVATQTKPGSSGVKGGPLSADGGARSVASRLFSTSGALLPAGQVRGLTQLGISVTREGRYSFDEAKLAQSMREHPADTTGLLSAFGASVVAFAKQAGGPDGPTVRGAAAAGTQARTRQAQIDALDQRLETVQRRYTVQYAKLNAALSMLQGQSSQLAAALGMPS